MSTKTIPSSDRDREALEGIEDRLIDLKQRHDEVVSVVAETLLEMWLRESHVTAADGPLSIGAGG